MIFTYCLVLLVILNVSRASHYESVTVNMTIPERVEDFDFNVGKKGKHQSKSPKLQIANGLTAGNSQFPYVAQLQITDTAGGGGQCTASLIGPSWLLTARHCIPASFMSILAIFGSADSQSTSRVKIFVDRATWVADGGTYPNGTYPDIALLHLAQSVVLSSTIKTVRLPGIPKENFGYDGYEITNIGWGLIKPDVPTRYLQYAYFKILPSAQCNFGPYTFCCLTPAGGSTTLGGDSGGPSVIVESDGIETLVGVNHGISKNGAYQVRTRVSSFLRWIQQQTGIVYNRDSLVVPVGSTSLCLTPGSYFFSASNCYYLRFQTDGNIVAYSKNGASIWSTNTAGKGATRFCMQSDGNLVLYNVNTPVWQTGTFNNPGAYAKLQSDASLAIFKAGTSTNPIWKSVALTNYLIQC